MVPMIIGVALACLALGFSLGFLCGCVWHAHFALLNEPDVDVEGDPQWMDRK